MDETYSRRDVAKLIINISRGMLARQLGQQTAFGGARQYYDVLGYKQVIGIDDYLRRYERQDIAQRIVDIPAEDTWGKPPKISEQGNEDTEFVRAWQELVKEHAVWNRLMRADKLSRIGRYGILLIGLRDGLGLSEPVSGPSDVLYLTPYHEGNVEIKVFDEDPQSPRYGLPEIYEVEIREDKMRVHWSRVLHLAENRVSSEVYGMPPLKAAFNRLDDLMKIVGGTAEATWMNMRKGTLLGVQEGYDASSMTEQKIEDEIENYAHDPMRMLWLQGVSAQDIGGSEVVDPSGPFDVIMSLIAAVTGIPQRRLMGSAQGALASAKEDTRQWAMRVAGRQQTYAEPDILRPFIDRLMEFGALPLVSEYHIGELSDEGGWHWPPIAQMTEQEQADVTQARAAATRALADPLAAYPLERDEMREMLGYKAETEQPVLAAQSHKGELVTRMCPLCSATKAWAYPDHKGLLVCAGCGKTYDPSIE